MVCRRWPVTGRRSVTGAPLLLAGLLLVLLLLLQWLLCFLEVAWELAHANHAQTTCLSPNHALNLCLVRGGRAGANRWMLTHPRLASLESYAWDRVEGVTATAR